MDGFHLSNEELTRLGRRAWKGAPDTFDIQGFADLLKLIKVGKSDLSFPLFERALEASIPNAGSISARAKLILVEGNYLRLQISGWELLEGLLDESWYLQIPDSLRLERLINRHVEFGKSREQAEAWALGTDEANARLIAATASRADRIINLR